MSSKEMSVEAKLALARQYIRIVQAALEKGDGICDTIWSPLGGMSVTLYDDLATALDLTAHEGVP